MCVCVCEREREWLHFIDPQAGVEGAGLRFSSPRPKDLISSPEAVDLSEIEDLRLWSLADMDQWLSPEIHVF